MSSKLLELLQILSSKAWERIKERIRDKPEYFERSLLLKIKMAKGLGAFYMHVTQDGVKVLLTKPKIDATLIVSMPYSVFSAILKRQYDPDYAVSKGWIRFESKDGFYHYTILREYLQGMIDAIQED